MNEVRERRKPTDEALLAVIDWILSIPKEEIEAAEREASTGKSRRVNRQFPGA